jgi:parvulin-like peptidyl-prolyl isomerase
MADQIKAAHILCMYEGSLQSSASRSKEEAKAKIEEVKTKLDAGGDFAELATEHSDCPSGKSGGSLGTFSRGSTVKEFEEVAFNLEVGKLSDVVETRFGFHIIRRDE